MSKDEKSLQHGMNRIVRVGLCSLIAKIGIVALVVPFLLIYQLNRIRHSFMAGVASHSPRSIMKLRTMIFNPERKMGVAWYKTVRTAIAASVMVHAIGFAALAVWSTRSMTSRVQFAGREQVIQLTVSLAEPQWSPEPVSIELLRPDPPIVIEPTKARIGKRQYAYMPTERFLVDDFFPDIEREITSGLQDRATSDDFYDVMEPPRTPKTRTIQRRRAPPKMPDSAVVEPPSSLADTDGIPPDLSQNAPPTYPAYAIQRGWEGTVLLRVWIDETGRVTKVEVARSSGHRILDGAAVNAIRQWKAIPANRGGEPVTTIEVLPVRFKL